MSSLRVLRMSKTKSYNSLNDDVPFEISPTEPDNQENNSIFKKDTSKIPNAFNSLYLRAQKTQKSFLSNNVDKWNELQSTSMSKNSVQSEIKSNENSQGVTSEKSGRNKYVKKMPSLTDIRNNFGSRKTDSDKSNSECLPNGNKEVPNSVDNNIVRRTVVTAIADKLQETSLKVLKNNHDDSKDSISSTNYSNIKPDVSSKVKSMCYSDNILKNQNIFKNKDILDSQLIEEDQTSDNQNRFEQITSTHELNNEEATEFWDNFVSSSINSQNDSISPNEILSCEDSNTSDFCEDNFHIRKSSSFMNGINLKVNFESMKNSLPHKKRYKSTEKELQNGMPASTDKNKSDECNSKNQEFKDIQESSSSDSEKPQKFKNKLSSKFKSVRETNFQNLNIGIRRKSDAKEICQPTPDFIDSQFNLKKGKFTDIKSSKGTTPLTENKADDFSGFDKVGTQLKESPDSQNSGGTDNYFGNVDKLFEKVYLKQSKYSTTESAPNSDISKRTKNSSSDKQFNCFEDNFTVGELKDDLGQLETTNGTLLDFENNSPNGSNESSTEKINRVPTDQHVSNSSNPFGEISNADNSVLSPFNDTDLFWQKSLRPTTSMSQLPKTSTDAFSYLALNSEKEFKNESPNSENDSGFDSHEILNDTNFISESSLKNEGKKYTSRISEGMKIKSPLKKLSFSSTNLTELNKRVLPDRPAIGSIWDMSADDGDDEFMLSPKKKVSKLQHLEMKATHLMFSKFVSGGLYSNSGGASMMPAQLPEEASLLGGDGGDDLRGIQVTVASGGRTIQNDGSLGEVVEVETPHGTIKVYARGDPSRPTILTYPDLGLNAVMNFQSFFQHPDMTLMLQCFRVVCMNAPGMEEQAPNLPDGYVYPNMDQLAETVERVRTHLNIRNFIGFGVGLGANVLCRYTLEHPSNVDALLLINCSASTCGWMEWAYQKLNVKHLRKGQMTTGAVDYLMWHSFGKLDTVSQDVVKPFKEYFEKHCNATNLSYIVEAYIGRNDLHIVREMDQNKKKEARMLRCPVLNITSNASPHVDATVAFNARLDPSNSSWMKIQDAGMVLEEKPTKMAEAFKLFLQGQGYVVGSSRRASSVAPSHIEALQSRRLKNRQNSLPLIRDVPIVKPSAELSSRLATTEENAAEGAEALASIIPMSKDDSVIKTTPKEDDLVSKDGGGAAAEKDIRITENPLEQPSV